ncbi:MAG TPA: hypothetical protein VGA49_01030 [Patescibacteria group bacterium]
MENEQGKTALSDEMMVKLATIGIIILMLLIAVALTIYFGNPEKPADKQQTPPTRPEGK